MTQEQIEQVIAIHKEIQRKCNESLLAGCEAIRIALQLSKGLEGYKKTIPEGKTLEQDIEATFPEDVQPWLLEYMKVAALKFAAPFHNTKASVMQKAFKILDIIPQIVTTAHE